MRHVRNQTSANSRPLPEEIESDNNKRDGQSDPDAENAALRMEAQRVAERQSEEPVSAEVDKHRLAGLAGATQRSRRDGLNTVENLEGGGKHEHTCAEHHDCFVLRVNVQQRPR